MPVTQPKRDSLDRHRRLVLSSPRRAAVGAVSQEQTAQVLVDLVEVVGPTTGPEGRERLARETPGRAVR